MGSRLAAPACGEGRAADRDVALQLGSQPLDLLPEAARGPVGIALDRVVENTAFEIAANSSLEVRIPKPRFG